jgi:hypothetical protein
LKFGCKDFAVAFMFKEISHSAFSIVETKIIILEDVVYITAVFPSLRSHSRRGHSCGKSTV